MESTAAIKRERQLKKWSRAKKMALIQGDLKMRSIDKVDTRSNQWAC
ncbi:hypothetical protein [Cerasicoccus arenae]|nr:hypothetical protein [Cerasicoccus arenae]